MKPLPPPTAPIPPPTKAQEAQAAPTAGGNKGKHTSAERIHQGDRLYKNLQYDPITNTLRGEARFPHDNQLHAVTLHVPDSTADFDSLKSSLESIPIFQFKHRSKLQ